jgi:hypothetical protein
MCLLLKWKCTVCLHFELLYVLKYDVLSEYLTSFWFAMLLNENVRRPIRVIHAQKVKSPHNITKHTNKSAIHATISRFTLQFHDSRHNFTIRATIPRFTPQFHDSRHKFTIHTTKKPLTNHGLNIH